jgi:hypothetical protein
MFTFNSDALAQLFHETYHQAMSVRLVISSQDGLFLEFQSGLPGQLFYRKARIYALEYSGGSTDPGVQVELKFGQISEEYELVVDDPAFFSAMTANDKVVVLSVRSAYQLKRKSISWLSHRRFTLFRERIDIMRTSDFLECSCDEERAVWFDSAASMLEDAIFTDSERFDRHQFYFSRKQLRLRLNSITAEGKLISSVR